tara:strand:- start:2387 stop:4003 length:1617 start_codon:yes stop_codon:yes gene_type:complete
MLFLVVCVIMPHQLQINQGPQDALLYDNSRSYFTNVGYVRTSNFQVEYRNVDSQNTAQLGSTVQYVIPKAADLLGAVDLVCEFKAPKITETYDSNNAATGNTPTAGAGETGFLQWVDELGFAMIEKATFSIGSNDIETLTGEQMQIRNELMTSDEMRLGYFQTLKTGRAAFDNVSAIKEEEFPGFKTGTMKKGIQKDTTRLIVAVNDASTDVAGSSQNLPRTCDKRRLIIPLSFFFTQHVSQYFPLAAVAGCNDVRISIKFRALKELVQKYESTGASAIVLPQINSTLIDLEASETKLRCHYVHVTGPEAKTLMSKEHVRLLKLWQHQHKIVKASDTTFEMDLSFLHPVSTLLITVRDEADLAGDGSSKQGFFFYHGDGTPPNYDDTAFGEDDYDDKTVSVSNIKLTLNGQERHPGLDKGIDTDYLRYRLLPMLHSNSNMQEQLFSQYGIADRQKAQYRGAKNVIAYPFSLNPEGSNPSGAVNFSKVSHAKLSLTLDTTTRGWIEVPAGNTNQYRIDVYALYYNWLQIKDGRALLSFA